MGGGAVLVTRVDILLWKQPAGVERGVKDSNPWLPSSNFEASHELPSRANQATRLHPPTGGPPGTCPSGKQPTPPRWHSTDDPASDLPAPLEAHAPRSTAPTTHRTFLTGHSHALPVPASRAQTLTLRKGRDEAPQRDHAQSPRHHTRQNSPPAYDAPSCPSPAHRPHFTREPWPIKPQVATTSSRTAWPTDLADGEGGGS